MKHRFIYPVIWVALFLLSGLPTFADELDFIGEAIAGGDTSDDLRKELEYIALGGLTNQSRENGRLTNNSPSDRARAVVYLGDLGTAEAKTTLLKILRTEVEPMVLTLAIKSLARIGLNDKEETTNTIAWVAIHFDNLNPDNLLALSSLDAIEALAKKSGGLKDPSIKDLLTRISKGRYIKAVQARAQRLLVDLRKYDTK
ncbi:hypothetical protein AGMMS49942_21040 [Spirochaetia bacterium]|nr:hypothetical protein AGMMS49942_21040 [Spirochaetia bacterium]